MDNFKYAFDNDLANLQLNLDFIGVKDQKGKSLLHHAVLGSAIDVIDYLLNQDMDVNMLDQGGETPLFDCVRKGKLIIAKKLINKYAKIDITNSKNETLLHLACHKGDLDMIKLLLEKKANLNALTTDDKLPIHYAILAGHVNVVNYLMDISNASWFDVDQSQNSFLHYASKTTNVALISLLIEKNLDVNGLNDQFETPLFNAVKFGTKETVMLLLKNDAYIDLMNRRYETPLTLARINNQTDIVELLREWMISPTYIKLLQNQSLTLAVLNRDYNKLRQLLEQGNRLKKDRLKYTALDYASKYKLTVCINLLRPYV